MSRQSGQSPLRIELGPFHLLSLLARGAMGEVWHAVHGDTQVPVAIKMIRTELQGRARHRASFRAEVARTARLSHPHIVQLLDYGEVDPQTARHSAGRLREGAAWIAMEFASGGTLADPPEPQGWRDVVQVVSPLLSALAHAHTRGVLHRDIKPANILRGGPADLRPGLKLSDFGIAHAWDDEGGHRLRSAGTPAYMAPEQIEGSIDEQGPWTDLYAIGGLVWRLVTGANAFVGANSAAIRSAHLQGLQTHFRPRFEVPSGVEAWIRGLLLRAPFERTSSAAAALRTLPGTDPEPTVPYGTDPSATFDDGEAWTPSVAAPAPSPPPAPVSPPLAGAGLGLFGLRTPPFVARQAELEACRGVIEAATQTRTLTALRLTGSRGLGRSRLLSAVAEAADEQGHAIVVAIAPSEGVGLAAALRRALSLSPNGPPPHADLLRARLEGLTSPSMPSIDGLRAWWGDERAVSAVERGHLLASMLRGLAGQHTVLVTVDDIQKGGEAMAALSAAVDQVRDLPVALLVAEAGETDSAWSAWFESRGFPSRQLLPLAPLEVSELLRQLLVLDQTLGDEIIRRAEGSPLFAIQLVGELVRRKALVPGPEGFQRAGPPPPLPGDIHALWQARLEAIQTMPNGPAHVEVAAALALDDPSISIPPISTTSWDAVSAHLGLGDHTAVRDKLVHLGLLEFAAGAWRFTHGLLRASVALTMRAEGRSVAVHRACAQVHAALDVPSPHALGLHLLAANQPADALPPLLDAAERALRRCEYATCHAILDRVDDARVAAGHGKNHPFHGRRGLLELRALVGQGRFEAVRTSAGPLATLARREGWLVIASSAQRLRGMAAEKAGHPMLAEALFTHAHQLAEQCGDSVERGAALMHLGTLARLRGDSDAAESLLSKARPLLEDPRGADHLAWCLADLAVLCFQRDDIAGGTALSRSAMARFESQGNRTGAGLCANLLGEALRKNGQQTAAAAIYAEAEQALGSVGAHARVYPLVNLGLMAVEAGALDNAKRAFTEAEEVCDRHGDRLVGGYVQVALAHCAVIQGAFGDGRHHLDAATPMLEQTGFVEPDLERMLREVLETPGLPPAVAELARPLWQVQARRPGP